MHVSVSIGKEIIQPAVSDCDNHMGGVDQKRSNAATTITQTKEGFQVACKTV